MDGRSRVNLPNQSQSSVYIRPNSGVAVNLAAQSLVCGLCQRVLSPSTLAAQDRETVNLCGDCKFLFLEDIENPIQDSHPRMSSRRRTRYNSPVSMEYTFSQQFSHIISRARQNQSIISSNEDGEAGDRIMHTSNQTTPSGSSRWGQGLSEADAEGAEYFDSSWESESNFSSSHYRARHGDSDVVSFSTYGGESDASIDGSTFLGVDLFAQLNDVGSDSDTDIDPMHTGFNLWNAYDGEEGEEDQGEEEEDEDEEEEEEEEEEEVEEDGEWEEEEAHSDYVIDSPDSRAEPQNFIASSLNESNNPNWLRQLQSPEYEGTFNWSMRRGRQTTRQSIHESTDLSGLQTFIGNAGDYLDARGFEELLEHLAETNSSRRGTPPASIAIVERLPQLVVGEDNQKYVGSACAICKEVLSTETVVNQLPCFHLYHPSCILPWLSSRNSCPLCRYELPTDDKDYEEQKQNVRTAMELHRLEERTAGENSSSVPSHGAYIQEENESNDQETVNFVDSTINQTMPNRGRGRWFVLTAAAPILGIVGLALALWLGNPLLEGRGQRGNFTEQNQHQNHVSSSSPNQRETRSHGPWSIF